MLAKTQKKENSVSWRAKHAGCSHDKYQSSLISCSRAFGTRDKISWDIYYIERLTPIKFNANDNTLGKDRRSKKRCRFGIVRDKSGIISSSWNHDERLRAFSIAPSPSSFPNKCESPTHLCSWLDWEQQPYNTNGWTAFLVEKMFLQPMCWSILKYLRKCVYILPLQFYMWFMPPYANAKGNFHLWRPLNV